MTCFSALGRPAKDSQLINGLLIVKHMKGYSDNEVVEELRHHPYIQYFCGYDKLVDEEVIEPSTLSKARKRLGNKYFIKFENEILNVLKEKNIIKGRIQSTDATVFPANITYPTDTGLIEMARIFVVGSIKRIKKVCSIKEKIRTYSRKARQIYIRFQKKRRKTVKDIRKAKKQGLQYLRRNIAQLQVLLGKAKDIKKGLKEKIEERLEVVKKVYDQQMKMLKDNTHSIGDRIVSLHLPHIRPIKRGKSGKETEFGPKAVISYVDGYAFLDIISFNAFNEAKRLKEDITLHRDRFGRNPDVMVLDNIFATKENRELLRLEGIRSKFLAIGSGTRSRDGPDGVDSRLLKQDKKFRNLMEGIIGNCKSKYGLDRILYRISGGEEIWVRMGLMAMNLSTALKRI